MSIHAIYRMGSPDLRRFPSEINISRQNSANLKYRWSKKSTIHIHEYTRIYRMGSPDLTRFPSEINISRQNLANLNLGHEYTRYIVWGVQI